MDISQLRIKAFTSYFIGIRLHIAETMKGFIPLKNASCRCSTIHVGQSFQHHWHPKCMAATPHSKATENHHASP